MRPALRRAPVMLAVAMLSVALPACDVFGPDTRSVSFFVAFANDTDETGQGPAVDTELVMTYTGRNAELDFVPMSRESGVLGPGQTEVVEYDNGRLEGEATFEARAVGSQTALATATCTHREERADEAALRRASFRGDAESATGYSIACVDW